MTVYARQDDIAQMFATPRFVIKQGQVIVEEGQLRRAPQGNRLYVRPGVDDAVLPGIKRHFNNYSTVRFDRYPVRHLPNEPLRVG